MKDRIIRIGKILISILLMCLLLRNINFEEFKTIITTISIKTVLIAIFIYVTSVVINAIKWHALLHETRLIFLIFLSFRSQLYSTILPGQLFGEASKLTLWKNKGQDMMKVTASIIFDKITGMIGQVLLAIIGFSFSDIGREMNSARYFGGLGLIFVMLVLISGEKHVALLLTKMISFVRMRQPRLGVKLDDLYSAWRTFSIDKIVLGKSVFWGMANQFMGIVMIWYVASSMSLTVKIIDFCWIMPMLSFVLLIPISFAGIGLRDASLSSMLSIYGVIPGKSIVISSMLLLGQIVSSIIGGLMILCTNIRYKKTDK